MKISAGKWRSADGTRQFRAKKNDITGQHGFPHVHFEFLKKNVHVRYSSKKGKRNDNIRSANIYKRKLTRVY